MIQHDFRNCLWRITGNQWLLSAFPRGDLLHNTQYSAPAQNVRCKRELSATKATNDTKRAKYFVPFVSFVDNFAASPLYVIRHLALLLLLTACVTSPDEPRRESEVGQPTPIATTAVPLQPTYDVQRGEVVLQLEFVGRIVPAVDETLVFTIEGQVLEVYANRGDVVEAGMLLAELDRGAIEAALLQTQTDLAKAEAQLTAGQTQLDNALRRAEIERDLAQLDLDFARGQAGDNPTVEQAYAISRRQLELELCFCVDIINLLNVTN